MAPGSPSIDSLFDFLYVDRSRLTAFAAQLFNQGVLQITKTKDITAGKSGGSLDLGAPKLLGITIAGGSEVSSEVEQQFDASWSLPLNVLDSLDEHGYIRPDITRARLGEIFVIEGSLRFFDYRLLKDCWEQIAPMTIEQQNKVKPMTLPEKENLKNTFKIMQKLPHSVELILHADSAMIWTFLNPGSLTVSSETLAFTHGTSIPGSWFMVATLDATPKDADKVEADLLADLKAKPMIKEFQTATAQVVDGLRKMLGRPHGSYAATPLVIFRKIKAPSEPIETSSD
jgi:hypothetical protein